MRQDDDDWDITESVGLTALGVAAGRAVETRREDGLVDDPYAEAFVEAAGVEGMMPATGDGAGGGGAPGSGQDDGLWFKHTEYLGVRSLFFDRFFADAAQEGVTQAVILAAGLDTRAFRLEWPAGSTVYELDQSRVLAFKDEVLADRGAEEAAGRRTVEIDLREDWPAALRAAGFDPDAPTAWLAEGLLPYLPASAEEALFARIQELSAPGSAIAVEHFGGSIASMMEDSQMREASERFGVDVSELIYDEPRRDPADWLRDHGWEVDDQPATARAEAFGRPLPSDVAGTLGTSRLVSGRRATPPPAP